MNEVEIIVIIRQLLQNTTNGSNEIEIIQGPRFNSYIPDLVIKFHRCFKLLVSIYYIYAQTSHT